MEPYHQRPPHFAGDLGCYGNPVLRTPHRWWEEVLPCLENEDASGSVVNPFKELYWKQYGGPGPDGVAPPAQ